MVNLSMWIPAHILIALRMLTNVVVQQHVSNVRKVMHAVQVVLVFLNLVVQVNTGMREVAPAKAALQIVILE